MSIKTVLIFLSFISIGFLSGCTTNVPSNMVWYNPNKSTEQLIADEADCRNMVRFGQRGVPIDEGGAVALIGIISENNRENDIYTDCMISKGYLLVKTNSPFLTSSQPQPVYVTPEIEAKLVGHWMCVPAPENPVRGQFDLYFLPQHRWKGISSLTNTNGQLLLPPSDTGRYYFSGNKLVT